MSRLGSRPAQRRMMPFTRDECGIGLRLRGLGRARHVRTMLHLIKLAVGPKDVAELAANQGRRAALDPPLRHQTRSTPRRAAELLDGGSLYWVVAGWVRARQTLLDIRPEAWDDGSACAGLVLDPQLILVEPRATKPFQGWRYLETAAAPADLPRDAVPTLGLDGLPDALRRELEALCLI